MSKQRSTQQRRNAQPQRNAQQRRSAQQKRTIRVFLKNRFAQQRRFMTKQAKYEFSTKMFENVQTKLKNTFFEIFQIFQKVFPCIPGCCIRKE